MLRWNRGIVGLTHLRFPFSMAYMSSPSLDVESLPFFWRAAGMEGKEEERGTDQQKRAYFSFSCVGNLDLSPQKSFFSRNHISLLN